MLTSFAVPILLGKKQIIIESDAVGGTVVYTVPANRIFVGKITTNSTSYYYSINGKLNNAGVNTNVYLTPEVTLVAGTYVTKTSAGSLYIFGVEYDA